MSEKNLNMKNARAIHQHFQILKSSHFQIVVLASFFILHSALCIAQDIHFSQFYASPFNLNPALAGDFDRDDAFNPCDSLDANEIRLPFAMDDYLRITANQRTQWRSVTIPYKTLGFAADGFVLKRLPNFATALSFYNDKTGDSFLRTTILNIAGAYRQYINHNKATTITPGIEIGFTSYSIDYSQLKYDNQWNGTYYQPSLNHGESYARDKRTNLNIHAGVQYKNFYSKNNWIEAGISVFNLNNPKQSWFDEDLIALDARWNFHAARNFPVNEKVEVTPRALLMLQGTYREFDLGATANYILNAKEFSYRSFYGGLFFRTRDAGFILAGMKYDTWDVGISYDINLSDLRPASRSRGGFEFSVAYIFKRVGDLCVKYKRCPDFM